MPQTKIIKGPAATVTLDEINPAAHVVIENTGGNKITITASGVTIETSGGGKIELSGPQVSVNSGALEVV